MTSNKKKQKQKHNIQPANDDAELKLHHLLQFYQLDDFH